VENTITITEDTTITIITIITKKKRHTTKLYDSDSSDDEDKKHIKRNDRKHRAEKRKESQKIAVDHLHEKLRTLSSSTNSENEAPDIVPTSPQTAWQRLVQGNKRFGSGDVQAFLKNLAEEIHPGARMALLGGQKPYAIILTCSDSRVAPEILFDEGLGLLFVIRVAGNVVDPHVLGTIEYAVEHLHSILLVVMGHQFCGAVNAAVAGGDPPGSIGSLITSIAPAAEIAKKGGAEPAKILEEAVKHNVRNMKVEIMNRSAIVNERVKAGTLGLMGAEYNLETGFVTEVI